ncbi:MAG: Ig-like domain-containing protein, partial [Gammaproteobacteria bacterium]
VGQVVNFTATRGNLSATSSTTDASGRTTIPPITINSTNAGPSTITAFVTSGPSATVKIEFVATVPAAVTLQADKSTIGPNDGSEAVEQKAILTATLRDANNNLVKGKTLRFSIIQDTSGGTLTSAIAVTDSLGQASVSYVSSAATTATDEVIIKVEVEENTSVKNTVVLTVAQKALFVKLGTGNSITEPNSVVYELPYSVIVTDSGGNPVEGVLVTLKVSPTAYFKGWWELTIDDFWITRGGVDLASAADAFRCLSEDLGSDNGILDPGEDINLNSVLDPGNVVAVPTTVTTDENGTALFDLTYGQEFGLWTEVRLTASTEVNGTESIDTEIFTLTVAASDVNSADTSPPGLRRGDVPINLLLFPGPPPGDDPPTNTRQISPFGWSPDCTTDDVNFP